MFKLISLLYNFIININESKNDAESFQLQRTIFPKLYYSPPPSLQYRDTHVFSRYHSMQNCRGFLGIGAHILICQGL